MPSRYHWQSFRHGKLLKSILKQYIQDGHNFHFHVSHAWKSCLISTASDHVRLVFHWNLIGRVLHFFEINFHINRRIISPALSSWIHMTPCLSSFRPCQKSGPMQIIGPNQTTHIIYPKQPDQLDHHNNPDHSDHPNPDWTPFVLTDNEPPWTARKWRL